ncbi:transposase, partial [candidate division KSB1 bacterium]|nr:transposase [candidate division KSB1 bacterium]
DGLDLAAMGFTYSEPKETGRKPYNPGDMLKLYIYGYLNKIRSSRQLEKATHGNLELIWLMRRLQPDFKTIADFRKDNSKAIKAVFREFSLLCKRIDLFEHPFGTLKNWMGHHHFLTKGSMNVSTGFFLF